MAMYIYHTHGHPVGFRFGDFIHDLDGTPLGRVLGSHVYRIDGEYAGELFKDSVVDKGRQPRRVLPISPPPAAPSPGSSFCRRVVVNYGFPDAFDRLREQSGADPMSIAAE
jgi:hypothetical protein